MLLSASKALLLNKFFGKSRTEREFELLLGVLEASKEQSRAMTKMAEAFSDFIGSFKVDGTPQVYESADRLAWQDETVAAMQEQGMPIGATEIDRLKWIARQVDMAD